MLYFDRVICVERAIKKEFPMISTWINEEIKKQIEEEDKSYGFGKGTVDRPLDIYIQHNPRKQAALVQNKSAIKVINKTYSSLL